jgi:hypothetical protein
MSTVNKAKVWANLKVKPALRLLDQLDFRRVKPFYDYENVEDGYRKVGFFVPKGVTVQEALVLMAKLAPEGTEIFAS